MFELHWMMRNHQRKEFVSHKEFPAPNTVYILWDFKENLNLPWLTEEMSGVYFARARQSASICSLKIWRADASGVLSEWLTYAGIVLEKSTVYALAILEDALKNFISWHPAMRDLVRQRWHFQGLLDAWYRVL